MDKKIGKTQRFFRLFNMMLILAMVLAVAGTTLPVYAASPADEEHGGFFLDCLSKEKVAVNSPDFTMTLEGYGFLPGALVLWESTTELTPTMVNDHIIKVLITADKLTVPGTFHLSVKNPDGTVSNTESFKVTTLNTKPKITRLNPSKVNVETGAAGQTFQLLVYGKNFLPTAVVNWYDPLTLITTPLTKVGDCLPNLCTVTVDKALIGQKNSVKITVANGLDVSKSKTLKITMPKPILTSIDPATAPSGSPAITLNLTGDRFQVDSIVRWEDHPLPGPITFTDAQHISVLVPAEYLVKPGEFDVEVLNPGGAHSNDREFHVTGISTDQNHHD